MKTIPTRQWKKIWAIHFLFYFVCNCKESIENNEVFELVANLRSRTQWLSLIKEMIPEKKIARMKAARNCCDRLDLEHSRAAILREIWQAPYARGKLRRLLMMILSQEIDAHLGEAFKRNPYSNKLYELQYLLKLNNTERDILLILSFVSEDLLSFPENRFSLPLRQLRLSFRRKRRPFVQNLRYERRAQAISVRHFRSQQRPQIHPEGIRHIVSGRCDKLVRHCPRFSGDE